MIDTNVGVLWLSYPDIGRRRHLGHFLVDENLEGQHATRRHLILTRFVVPYDTCNVTPLSPWPLNWKDHSLEDKQSLAYITRTSHSQSTCNRMSTHSPETWELDPSLACLQPPYYKLVQGNMNHSTERRDILPELV